MSRSGDIERVRREGKALRTPSLLVRVSASPLSLPRVGIVVPRYGQSAVDRNRLKRRIRELVRVQLLPLGIPADVVIWAQRQGYRSSFDALRRELASVTHRLPQKRPDAPGATTPSLPEPRTGEG